MSLAVGDRAPSFALPDTSGTVHSPGGDAATIVVFTCNHCPYALAWHERLVAVARDFVPRGVRTLAINRNDAERYPRDSPRRCASASPPSELDDALPDDESQDVARAFGARTTPDVFVLDAGGTLAYRGAPDADHARSLARRGLAARGAGRVLGGRALSRAPRPSRSAARSSGAERVRRELALEDLAGRVARQLVDEHDLARHLVARRGSP